MKKAIMVLFIGAFVLATVISGWAILGASTSLEGTIKTIGTNMITINSKAADSEKMQEVSLLVNDQTKLNDFASLNDLKTGDKVKVDYKEEGNQKVAVLIDKQEQLPAAGATGNTGATQEPQKMPAGAY